MAKQTVVQSNSNGKAKKSSNGASKAFGDESLAADIQQGVAELRAYVDGSAGITRGELAALLGCGEDPNGSAKDMALASLTEAGFALDQALATLEGQDVDGPTTKLVYRASFRLRAALNILSRE